MVWSRRPILLQICWNCGLFIPESCLCFFPALPFPTLETQLSPPLPPRHPPQLTPSPRSGYIPITTCSPHNNAQATSYGAAATFDYHSPTCASDIKAHTQNSLRFALDCIGTAQSTALCHEAIGRSGGRYVALERYPESAAAGRRNVRGSWVLGPVMFGRRIEMEGYGREADAEAREFGREWYACVERLAREGKVRVHPPRRLGGSGGWARAVLEGLEILKMGEVSGEKLVVEVDEQV